MPKMAGTRLRLVRVCFVCAIGVCVCVCVCMYVCMYVGGGSFKSYLVLEIIQHLKNASLLLYVRSSFDWHRSVCVWGGESSSSSSRPVITVGLCALSDLISKSLYRSTQH